MCSRFWRTVWLAYCNNDAGCRKYAFLPSQKWTYLYLRRNERTYTFEFILWRTGRTNHWKRIVCWIILVHKNINAQLLLSNLTYGTLSFQKCVCVCVNNLGCQKCDVVVNTRLIQYMYMRNTSSYISDFFENPAAVTLIGWITKIKST